MLRTFAGAALILMALTMPAAADTTLEPSAEGRAQPSAVPAVQTAAVPDREAEGHEALVASAERPARLGKANYSPLGEAVLNLLRSQGGGGVLRQ